MGQGFRIKAVVFDVASDADYLDPPALAELTAFSDGVLARP
jgi:hypothetical protein